MKKLPLFLLLGLSLSAFASAGSLEGEYSLACTQTQINGRSGFVVESYSFEQTGTFEFTRTWFQDSQCEGEVVALDKEAGTYKLGKDSLNMGMNPQGTVEADFTVKGATDLGLLWTSSDQSQVRVARGMKGGLRNTMLSFFIYKK